LTLFDVYIDYVGVNNLMLREENVRVISTYDRYFILGFVC